MRPEATVLDLVDLIYDAAGDAAHWPVALGELRRVFKSSASTLYAYDFQHAGGTVAVTVGFDDAYMRCYDAYYATKNVYMTSGASLLIPGTVCRSETLCPDAEAIKSEFYNDWIVPQRLGYSINAILLKTGCVASLVGLIRSQSAPPFAKDDLRLLARLLPHLQRAVQIHQRITTLEIEKQAASDALNRWTLGVILFDAKGWILLMNRSAERILNERDGLSLDQGNLVVAQPGKTAVLRNLIRCATQTTLGRDRDPGGALTLPRLSGKRPLQVLVTPACSNRCLFPEPEAAAAVFVSDPEAIQETGTELLRQLYGLSRAEANAAVLLMDGTDVSGVAEKLGIALNTARTHVRRILAKTGTKRQGELIALLYKSPVALRGSLMKNHQFG